MKNFIIFLTSIVGGAVLSKDVILGVESAGN